MLKLWIVMSEMYGHKWTSGMGAEPSQTWSSGLAEISDTEWMAGLKMLKASLEDWPPSLPEFKRWCTSRMTQADMKAYAHLQAQEQVQKAIDAYNPNCAGPTYQQAERMERELSTRIFVQERENDRRSLLGLEKIDDPLRVCQDEEYL